MLSRVGSLIGIVTGAIFAGLFVWGLVEGPNGAASFFKWGAGISFALLLLSLLLYPRSTPLTVDNMPHGITRRYEKPYVEDEIKFFRFNLYGAMGLGAILICVWGVLFMMGLISDHPTQDDLFKIGGGSGVDIQGGQVWRLFTQIFIHGRFGHLAFNVLPLVLVGRFLEFFVGSKKLVILFLTGGVVGGLLSTFTHPYIVTVGAGPSLFAIYGAVATCCFYIPNFLSYRYFYTFATAALMLSGFLIFEGTKAQTTAQNFYQNAWVQSNDECVES